jgi:cytochrome P450
MQAPLADDFAFDPYDEAIRRDPYPLFARARREHPAWRHEGLPVVSVFRHADCQAILRDPQAWSNCFPPPPGFTEDDLPRSMLVVDPPEHTRLRGLVSQAFTPKRVRQLAPRIEAIAEELLDEALARGEVDFVEALTYPLPVIVIAEMIGVPPEDRAQFKAWSDALVAPLGSVFFAPPTPEMIAEQRRIRGDLEAYFVRLVEERRRNPADDLLTALVQAELEGSRLSFAELLAMLILLLVAGNETTTNLIGNTVLELLAHPDALAAVRADPTLVPGVIDEVLRFASPVQMDPRRATRDTELDGVPVAAGEFVLCWLGSANRDEAVFERPEVFDIRRERRNHLAFGFGPHYCLGASLATLEAEVALRVLLARTRRFYRPDDAPLPLHPSIVFRGVTRLPLVLEPAAQLGGKP